jgi:hypothetical protein
VLYGCETWSLTLREECRLTVFENRILRQIFRTKRSENWEWRRLHNEDLYSSYRLPNIEDGEMYKIQKDRSCSQNRGKYSKPSWNYVTNAVTYF